ncbi:unnamed protein product [Echinostoma caproni]|uniref:NGP1NT domain-containing protein n=1 Tax=Echinostoma caproni TaxID=27848 RepID=A0A183A1M2_9TREM|nr:unnamed protein product [Echinostoma caproni]
MKVRSKDKVNQAKHSMNPGNTRVISQDALQNFKEAMKVRNPYEIILRQTKLPVSLLDEKKQALVQQVETIQQQYDASRDRHMVRDDDGVRDMTQQPHFKAGQSKRLWNELFKPPEMCSDSTLGIGKRSVRACEVVQWTFKAVANKQPLLSPF